MAKLSNLKLKDLEKLPRNHKVRVYAGGEIRERTVGWLIRQKKEQLKRKGR